MLLQVIAMGKIIGQMSVLFLLRASNAREEALLAWSCTQVLQAKLLGENKKPQTTDVLVSFCNNHQADHKHL